jgi:hypothetical protein
MTYPTKKEIAFFVTVLGSIYGAPKLQNSADSEIISAMHDQLVLMSEKIDRLASSDSISAVNYVHLASNVDSLVIRARVEDGIRKAMQGTLNRSKSNWRDSYAAK